MNRDHKKQLTASLSKSKNKGGEKTIRNKADFAYLAPFNYRILKEIGRGGYGVVYKVN